MESSKQAWRKKHIFERNGLHVEVPEDAITSDEALLLPAIRDKFTPGFCAFLSSDEPPEIGTRIYLPVRFEHAPRVGAFLSKILPKITKSYVVKALVDMKLYPRPDSFTIYVGNAHRDAVLYAIMSGEIQQYLDSEQRISLFAKNEKFGISWMEGHARSSSGEERSSCVARALRMHVAWETKELINSIEREFKEAGLDARAPYRLSQESADGS